MIDRKGKVAPWPLCPTLWFRGAKEAGTHISRRTKKANEVFFSEDFFAVLAKSICWLGQPCCQTQESQAFVSKQVQYLGSCPDPVRVVLGPHKSGLRRRCLEDGCWQVGFSIWRLQKWNLKGWEMGLRTKMVRPQENEQMGSTQSSGDTRL